MDTMAPSLPMAKQVGLNCTQQLKSTPTLCISSVRLTLRSTGTGKTFTMEGGSGPELQGLIPNTFEHIFQEIEAGQNMQYLVRASFLEIYNEEIRDLLSKNPKDKLELKETKDSGVYVKGLSAFVVKNVTEIKNVLEVRQAQNLAD
jgi:hypothetical protein